jgi:hypothetical protein
VLEKLCYFLVQGLKEVTKFANKDKLPLEGLKTVAFQV